MTLGAVQAQTGGGREYYRSPVSFPILLAGNVGEIRSDHFHTGIDIRATQGVGSPIYAVADGYVSRIGVGPTGYGHVLYVSHPNGETSVYGHLDSFVPAIVRWVRRQQYAKKSFRVDLYPGKEQFPVAKGERIASLGNSGSSGGPHLHFEVRDVQGRPRNLIAQGVYEVPDRVAPIVSRVLIFEVDTVSVDGISVSLHRLRHTVPLRQAPDGTWVPEADSLLPISTSAYLAYEVIDYKDGRSNTMGVYSIRQAIDGIANFSFSIDRLSFATNGFVNTFVSYPENHAAKRTSVLRAYQSPNNKLHIYRSVKERGVIQPPLLPGCGLKRVETTVEDDAGNQTEVRLYLTRDLPASAALPQGKAVAWDRPFRYADGLLQVDIPAGALYESAVLPFGADSVTGTVRVGDANVPLQKSVEIRIKAEDLPVALRGKALLAVVDENGKLRSAGGAWAAEMGAVKATTKRFGQFTVAVDTLAPVLRPVYASGTQLPAGRSLSFKATDDLSGISRYTLTVDGVWALLEYDPKNNLLQYTPTRNATPVKHSVVLTVGDAKGNSKTFKGTYIW